MDSQNIEFMSHESKNQLWEDGQRRFINLNLRDWNRNSRILDIACGDGVGLSQLQSMVFQNAFGVDSNPIKILEAKKHGDAWIGDMHKLNFIEDKSVDVILCSHSLEDVFEPTRVLLEFLRILTDKGILLLVLPYPDYLPVNERAHLAKYLLGLHRFDHGRALRKFLNSSGFKVKKVRFDSYREDEIWVTAVPGKF